MTMITFKCDGCGKEEEQSLGASFPHHRCEVRIGNCIVAAGELCSDCASKTNMKTFDAKAFRERVLPSLLADGTFWEQFWGHSRNATSKA